MPRSALHVSEKQQLGPGLWQVPEEDLVAPGSQEGLGTIVRCTEGRRTDTGAGTDPCTWGGDHRHTTARLSGPPTQVARTCAHGTTCQPAHCCFPFGKSTGAYFVLKINPFSGKKTCVGVA